MVLTADDLRKAVAEYEEKMRDPAVIAKRVSDGVRLITAECYTKAQKGCKQYKTSLPPWLSDIQSAVIDELLKLGFVVENTTETYITIMW